MSENWFRDHDIERLSTRWIIMMTILGALIGLVVSTFFLIYVGVFNDWFFAGVIAGTIGFGSLAPLRNLIVGRVASHGFPAAYNMQRLTFLFYIGAVVSGAVGVQEPKQVLPFAALFLVLIYLFLLWSFVLDRRELGRLYIFQFLTERDRNGRGYQWLQKGLRIIRLKLQAVGVSVKRNTLYFGSSYSLFDGSDVDGDLDKLYFLGDWSSNARVSEGLHEVTSWFLNRGIIGKTEGFESATPLADYFVDTLWIALRSVKGAVVFAGALVGLVVGVIQLLQYFGIPH